MHMLHPSTLRVFALYRLGRCSAVSIMQLLCGFKTTHAVCCGSCVRGKCAQLESWTDEVLFPFVHIEIVPHEQVLSVVAAAAKEAFVY